MPTTGPFQFPMWGRPSPIYIPSRRAHPFAELMAGVGQGLKAYTEATKEKEARDLQREVLEEERMAKRGMYPITPEGEGYQAPPEGLTYGKHTKRAYIPFKPKIVGNVPLGPTGQMAAIIQTSPSQYQIQTGAAPPQKRQAPSLIREYEMAIFGAETPERRGTASYRAGLLKYIRTKKEQSPYVDALITNQERALKMQAKKEGTALRKEFLSLPEVKQFAEFRLRHDVMQKAIEQAEKIETLKKGNLVAIDQAIITTFNKMTDPDSVVRESEYARTASDLALWNRLKGKIEKWQRGGAGLTIDDRRALAKLAKQFYEVALQKNTAEFYRYQDYIREYGLDSSKYLKKPKWLPSMPTSQDEYDKLPSGTIYLDPDDERLYRKP